MYDSHIFCKEYKELKEQVIGLLNGEETVDLETLSNHIQELYDEGDMSSSEYDDLMSYIVDMI